MIVMIERRRIELRITGSHAPPDAEEQARKMLKACCDEPSRTVRARSDYRMPPSGLVAESQHMAEVIITKYGPHG